MSRPLPAEPASGPSAPKVPAVASLRAALPNMTPREASVARMILANPGDFPGMALTEVSRRAEVSTATVVRCCRAAGFRGYREFQLALVGDMGRAPALVAGDILPDDSPMGVVKKVFAADVEAIHDDACHTDQALHFAERVDVGIGRHGLGPDVEGDAELARDLPRLDQQARSQLPAGAELALQRNAAVDGRHGDANEEREISRGAGTVRRLLDDLAKLVLAIERKAPDAVLVVRAANGFARLHGMHEMQVCARDRGRILDLGERGHVEMADARAVKRADQENRAVGLVGIRHVALEIFEEPARGTAGGMGTRAKYGALRLTGGDEFGRRIVSLHLTGPPPTWVGQEAPCEAYPPCVRRI